MEKFTSRKFLLSLAAFLGSIGTSITGYAIKDERVTIIGIFCATMSAAIYAACEAAVDASSAGSITRNVTEVTTTTKATNTNLQKDLVEEAKLKGGNEG